MHQFQVSKCADQKWSIKSLDGALQGQVVAVVEGVVLKDAILTPKGDVVGAIDAIWGAEITDAAFDDMATVLALGLNRAFREKDAITPIGYDGERWYSHFNSGTLRRAACHRVVILRENVHVSLT